MVMNPTGLKTKDYCAGESNLLYLAICNVCAVTPTVFVLFAVCVVSKGSRQLVLPRTSCLIMEIFKAFLSLQCLGEVFLSFYL
jgi:hypothetical protein